MKRGAVRIGPGRGGSTALAAAGADTGSMTLSEHIRELRSRLVRAALGVILGMLLAFVFHGPVFRFLTHPYCSLPSTSRLGGNRCDLIVTGVLDAFTVQIKIAAIAGIVLSSPIWVYQLWAFVAPGLHRHERRWAGIFAGVSALLFGLGAAFAYYTLGRALKFLLSFTGTDVTALIELPRYLSFLTTMLLVFGVSFEFPLLVVLLNLVGLVSAAKLRGAWRVTVFGIFVFAAVATPSQDPLTMSAMAVPLSLFYGIAIAIATVHDRRKARREALDPLHQLSPDEASPLELDG